MSNDGAGLSDDVRAEVNGGQHAPARIPGRPAGSAEKPEWVEYVVALGMDRDAAAALTVEQLADMADRLGGVSGRA